MTPKYKAGEVVVVLPCNTYIYEGFRGQAFTINRVRGKGTFWCVVQEKNLNTIWYGFGNFNVPEQYLISATKLHKALL